MVAETGEDAGADSFSAMDEAGEACWREADSLGNSLAYQAGAELGEPVAKGLFTIKRLAPSENFREYGMWVIWQG
jgi:hypothetical protein